MSVKTGLLVISNPSKIGKILCSAKKQVNNTLYIQLLSALTEPFGCFHPNVFNSWPKFSQTIAGIYSQAATHCHNLDVRVLLSGIKYKDLKQVCTQQPIDLVIFDKVYSESDTANFIKTRLTNTAKECGIITVDNGIVEDLVAENNGNDKIYSHAVMGGTFDRLHIAHKLLLSEAALRSTEKVTVGVTEENMLESKTLWELVQHINERVKYVKEFLHDICPELEMNVVPISDPYGPTQYDSTMDVIIVSAETLRGGIKVNEVRKNNGLVPLDVVSIQLVDEPNPKENEESKISSSTTRLRMLGSLLKPVKSNNKIGKKPYVIGLTGGIGSGKSGIAKKLEELGALIIDCDKLAHELYCPGKPCHKLIVEAFGKHILMENEEINRKALGSIVFRDKKELQKLNSLVWPAIADAVQDIIKKTESSVVVVEAAVLLTANWQDLCHEIWVTLVPPVEATKRLMLRNGLTEEQAKARLDAQPKNKVYVEAANVVFCSLWDVDYTRYQVEQAWNLLQTRLP